MNVILFLLAAAASSGARDPDPRRLEIEFLYLDRSTCTRCVDTAMLGIPSSAPSSAPDTVPEYVTSSPRFHPLLIPETMRSGLPLRIWVMAMLTQSVGVPSTANTYGAMPSTRSGRRSVSA